MLNNRTIGPNLDAAVLSFPPRGIGRDGAGPTFYLPDRSDPMKAAYDFHVGAVKDAIRAARESIMTRACYRELLEEIEAECEARLQALRDDGWDEAT